jgi:hypothetical protein
MAGTPDLSRDLLQRVAEKFQVIHGDGRDRGGQRPLDHVGGVETAAQADFEQSHIGRVAREQDEGGRRFDLEHGDRRVAIGALAFGQHRSELVIGDERAAARPAEAEAFVDAHQIGRGVNVNAQSRRFENGAQERDGRALAVGAGDMDHRREPAMRVVERVQNTPDAIESEIDPPRMQREQPRDDRINRGHDNSYACAGTGKLAGGSGGGTVGAGGALVKMRQSCESVGRNSCRWTTRSTMP